MKNILLVIAGIILSACIQVEAAPHPNLWPHWQAHDPASLRQVDHSAWSRFLTRYLEEDHPFGINRILYALNSASQSCPELLEQDFNAPILMERNTKAYIYKGVS